MNSEETKEFYYILFSLAGTTYAIDSSFVKQMEMIENITPVPNSPSFVEGVIFSRGKVIPAINLRERFGFPKKEFDLKTRLIVVAFQNRLIGLIVDEASEFVSINQDQIQEVPETITSLSGKYLSGFSVLNKRPILIFNVEEAIALSDLTQNLIENKNIKGE
ncbi:MAG: chemotaxis protein CheW [Stygiobacter sp.]